MIAVLFIRHQCWSHVTKGSGIDDAEMQKDC